MRPPGAAAAACASAAWRREGHPDAERTARLVWSAAAVVLIILSGAVTIRWCAAMGGMGSMPMPGHWSMSMLWMRMPGQSWLAATAGFLGMWLVMMVAMMLPSFVPMAWRYRQAVRGSGTPGQRLGLLTLMGAGYLLVWALLGLAAFLGGVTLAACAMRHPALSRMMPVLAGVVVLGAGVVQFTAWKARSLACCRAAPPGDLVLPADLASAWRHGLRTGAHCSACCAGSTMVLLALGVMDLEAMALVMAAITAERLAPARARVAHVLGIVALASGMILIARAAGP